MRTDVGLAVVVPVLGRPASAEPLVDSYLAARTVEGRVLLVCSPGDHDELEVCRELQLRHRAVGVVVAGWEPGHGDFARKVNLGYRVSVEPFVFQAADDVEFTPGWDAEALSVAEETGCGVVGTNDAANPRVVAGLHSTHSLVARWYVEECGGSLDGPGIVFSEAYGHQYCDNELVELADSRGCFAFAARALVRHRHPLWGTAPVDDTYLRGRETEQADRLLYHERRTRWTR